MGSPQATEPRRAGRSVIARFVLAILPSLGALLIFGLGLWTGRHLAVRPFREQLVAAHANDTLGHLVGSKMRTGVADAFHDPAAAREEMDHYVWAIRSVLTPFVGNGPWPGETDNAVVNSMQFRASRELPMPKPPGVYRIFLTGGSTAFGTGASSQEKTIGHYLEETLNAAAGGTHYEVWTMANPAWASTHERIAIENRLSELAPDLVLSFSGNNDVHWGYIGRDVLWFRAYHDELFWKLLNTARKEAGFPAMPDPTRVESGPIPPATVAERLSKNVRLSVSALQQKGIPYVFVLQPTIAVATKSLSAREAEIRTSRQERIRYFADCYGQMKEQIPQALATPDLFIDESDVFRARSATEEIFIDSYHFGDRGNEIVGKALAERLWPILKAPHL